MTDSIERIALEMQAHRVFGSRIAELDDWATRLRALSPAGGDWVMVPREPTVEMLDAMNRVQERHNGRIYAAGIAASPQQEPGADVARSDELMAMLGAGDLTANEQLELHEILGTPSRQTLAGAGGERGCDWYEDEDTGSRIVDFDFVSDHSRQLSLILKANGEVAYAAYINGTRMNGDDAMTPEFYSAIRMLAAGTTGDGSARCAQCGFPAHAHSSECKTNAARRARGEKE